MIINDANELGPAVPLQKRQELSIAALRTSRNIAREWGITDDQLAQIIDVPADVEPEGYVAAHGPLVRMSLFLGIWRAHQELRNLRIRPAPVAVQRLMKMQDFWDYRRELMEMVDRETVIAATYL